MTHARLAYNAGIPLRYANRHGLIVGPTGTGKSVSLMRLVEQFSRQGVPVFVADVKGDVSAVSRSCPAKLLDCFGNTGAPLSVPFSAMGADLVARALDLTDAQSGCVEIAFAYATAAGRRLDTIADFRAVLQELKAGRADGLGTVSAASVGVIQRALLRLEQQGGKAFFRGPCFDVARLLQVIRSEEWTHADLAQGALTGTPTSGGLVSILQAQELINRPRVYAAFLLWLLSDLWQRLPEVGDQDKPRLVMIFDESHLLFNGLPGHLLQRIEQTVRLIRSKGVGVYFVTQAAGDIPQMIRDQLAHKLTHDRAHGVGVAMVETLDTSGRPIKPAKVRVALPDCPLGALTAAEMPSPAAAVAAEGDWLKMGKAEIGVLIGGLIAVPLLCGAVYLLWGKWLLALATVLCLWLFKKPAG